MRMIALSDTHNTMRDIKVPTADIVVHTGDATCRNTARELRVFNARMARLGMAPDKILYTPGNHDGLFETDPEFARSLVPAVTVLIDEAVIINGLKFYGCPWHAGIGTNYNGFMLVPGCRELSEACSRIPPDTDVLLTHGPAYEMLDRDAGGRSRGCHVLRRHLAYRDPSKRLHHIFGHAHESYGMQFDQDSNIVHINAASVDSDYRPTNPPVVIDLNS